MSEAPSALAADWLGAARRARDRLAEILDAAPLTAQRVEETGARGEGGDRTLVIDQQAEDAVFDELDRLHGEGHRFCVISEERGTVDFGGDDVLVVVDPLDGSLNAKRHLPTHALSIAVADGPTMADVAFGYVHDFGAREEWAARRGEGATLDGAALGLAPRQRLGREGRLEVVGIEAADPRWIAERIDALVGVAHRLRAFGAMAVSLAQVADARFDGMLSLKGCRAVDVAAAQLIVRESGGLVSFPEYEDPLAHPLDLEPRSPVVAARTPDALARLEAVLAS